MLIYIILWVSLKASWLLLNLTYGYHYLIAYFTSLNNLSDVNYDFIVVGAGTSGSHLAHRLAGNGYSVALIEAGPPSNFFQGIPILSSVFQKTPYDWQYETQSQKYSMKSLKNSVSKWPRGKSLGGTSMLNAMIYTRGHPQDFENWKKMGNVGWAYEDVKPFFDISANVSELGYPTYTTESGPMTLSLPRFVSRFSTIFEEAFKESGLKKENTITQTYSSNVYTQPDLIQENGWRYGSFNQFYKTTSKVFTTLNTITFAKATKILIDKNQKAYAIEIQHPSGNYKFKAKKEVILSAGAIDSPLLLLKSDIGPGLKYNLPVGYNLQDHVLVLYNVYSSKKGLSIDKLSAAKLNNYYELFINNRGPLTEVGLGILAYINSGLSYPQYPDLQINTLNACYGDDYGLLLKHISGFDDQLFSDIYEPYYDKQCAMMMPTLLRPKSRGFIKLGASNQDPPIIQPNYLQHPDDVKVLIEGLKFVNNLTQTKVFNENDVNSFLPLVKTCKDEGDKYWECFARTLTQTMFHPVGTCKMGPEDDQSSVVNPRLKVKNINGLRVADASIMPTIVSGNPHGTIVMIAEKAASMIMEDWPKSNSEQIFNKPKDEL